MGNCRVMWWLGRVSEMFCLLLNSIGISEVGSLGCMLLFLLRLNMFLVIMVKYVVIDYSWCGELIIGLLSLFLFMCWF